MKKFFYQAVGVAALATTATFGLLQSAASAASFTVTQENNSANLLNALLGTTSGLSNFTVTTTGDPQAFGLFSDDPFGLGTGVVLSTGNVVALPGENTSSVLNPDLSTNLSGDDVTTLEISFDADATADSVFFQYVFGSEEFREFGGSAFNDSFELLLNGVNLAKLSDGLDVTVNNLVPDDEAPLSNDHPDYINNPAGPGTLTKLDGYTKVLTFKGLLNKNAKNTLTFRIADVGDSAYDSAVLFKGGSISTIPPKDVPEPAAVLGLLAFGSIASIAGAKRKKAASI